MSIFLGLNTTIISNKQSNTIHTCKYSIVQPVTTNIDLNQQSMCLIKYFIPTCKK